MTKEYIVIAFTENQIGVLNRITALYLRRKINIESLKVSESSIRGISMFVISAFTTRETIDKLVKQLRNIIDVIQVEYYSNEELITQEIHLANLPDYALAGMLAEILEDNGIPCHIQESGTLGKASSTYLGTSLLGYDLYVERDRQQEAGEWMNAFLNAPDETADSEDSEFPSC